MFYWLACFTGSFEIQLSMLIKEDCLVYFSDRTEKCILFINLVSAINQDMPVSFVNMN